MGPRLVSRGEDRMYSLRNVSNLASMGPRLVSRGEAYRCAAGGRECGFNGAAACEPRRGRARHSRGHRQQCFNGAAACEPRRAQRMRDLRRFRCASMGPRLVSRGEIILPTGEPNGNLASMGPRLVSRGELDRCVYLRHDNPLQWGRGL